MNAPRFPPDAVAQIRSLHSRGMLNVRAWAQAYNVSLETVRRIARGDTYRGGNAQPMPTHAQVIPPPTPPQGEPDGEALAASFGRLMEAHAAVAGPPAAQALLDELMAKGRSQQPGLPGGSATGPAPTPSEPGSGEPPP